MNLHCARAVVAFALFSVLTLGCAETQEEATIERAERPERRVLLIGIDGASMKVIEPMAREGRLPNLSRLMEQGASGNLRSLHPLLSPRVWTTVATGVEPDTHGILNWVTPETPDQPSRLYTSMDRKVHALWNIATDAGLSVGMVNWLVTYPPEPIRGVMLTDHALPGSEDNQRFMKETFTGKKDDEGIPSEAPKTMPPAWAAKVEAAAVAAAEPLTHVPNPFTRDPLPMALFRDKFSRYYTQDDTIARLALQIEEENEPDVLMVLFQGIDRTSHFFWGTLEPSSKYPEKLRFSDEEKVIGAEVLRTYYEYSDALIGKLLERYGPEDLVLVVSDHGFEAGVTWNIMTGIHNSEKAEDGVIFARGPGVQPGPAGDVSVTDITPTILAWLDLPVAEDMEGKPAPFLQVDDLEMIASYETKPVPRLNADAESGAEELYIQQLRELGYVE